jgi:hypothetical protein
LKQLLLRAKRQDRPITPEQWDALAWAFEKTVLSVPHCSHHSRRLYLAKLKFCLDYENALDPNDRRSFRNTVMAESFLRFVESRKARIDKAG